MLQFRFHYQVTGPFVLPYITIGKPSTLYVRKVETFPPPVAYLTPNKHLDPIPPNANAIVHIVGTLMHVATLSVIHIIYCMMGQTHLFFFLLGMSVVGPLE